MFPLIPSSVSWISYHTRASRFLTPRDNEKNGLVPVFKSEVCSGQWKPIRIDISLLCNCDYVLSTSLSHE